jgi:hypothetical protein
LIEAEKIDFLEISGGTYEDPSVSLTALLRMSSSDMTYKMLQSAAYAPGKKASTIQREAFFLDFAKVIRQRFPNLILMVTGGFRTRGAMEDALAIGACDLIGLARPAAAVPHLPKQIILNEKIDDSEAQIWLKPIKMPAVLKMVPVKSLTAGNETVCVTFLPSKPISPPPQPILFCRKDTNAVSSKKNYYKKQIQRIGRGLPPILPS